MSAVIAVAAALGLVGLGMLISPEMSRLRAHMRRRRPAREPARLPVEPREPSGRPTLRVIHGDGGTVVPLRPRQAGTHASSPPPDPRGQGPDAA